MPAVKPSPSKSIEPVSLSPETAAELSGVSVRSIYRLLGRKAITARRDGARTLIDYASWRTYFKSLPDYIPGASMPNAPHVTGTRKCRGKKVHS
jgi:excisionase family DNA binding protein